MFAEFFRDLNEFILWKEMKFIRGYELTDGVCQSCFLRIITIVKSLKRIEKIISQLRLSYSFNISLLFGVTSIGALIFERGGKVAER